MVKLSDDLVDVGVVESDEFGKFESLEMGDFCADELDSFLVEFLAAAKPKSIGRVFSVAKENCNFSVGDGLCAGKLGQIRQLVDEEVDSDVRTNF